MARSSRVAPAGATIRRQGFPIETRQEWSPSRKRFLGWDEIPFPFGEVGLEQGLEGSDLSRVFVRRNGSLKASTAR